MTATAPGSGNVHQYRFMQPGEAEVEIEVKAFDSDDAAEDYARDLPLAKESPIIIEKRGHVDWEYVTEVDERP